MIDEDQTIETLLQERDEAWQLLDTWRIALKLIARGHVNAAAGRIALEALDKEKRP